MVDDRRSKKHKSDTNGKDTAVIRDNADIKAHGQF